MKRNNLKKSSKAVPLFLILLVLTATLFISCEDTITRVIEEEVKLSQTTITSFLTGSPAKITNQTSLDIIVSGDEIIAYKYKLDNSSWSAEKDISVHLTAAGLAEGEHILLVLVKHQSGVWQSEEDVETVTWTVDTTPPDTIDITLCSYSASAGGIQLQWNSPAEKVLVLRSSSSTITTSPTSGHGYNVGDSIGDSVVIFKGSSAAYTDTGAGEGLRYYAAYAYDSAFNYAAGGTQDSEVTYDGHVYVNGNGGNDGDYGTSVAPKASIDAGISTADSFGIDTVRVTEGTYQASGPVVTLVEGVSIYGGYKNGDWNTRDPETFVSTISDVYSSGSYTLDSPRSALLAGTGITNNTVVDGFKIVGGHVNVTDATFTSAIFINSGGAPIIRNCTLNGGTSIASGSSTSVGLTIISASPVIEYNTIILGTGANKRGIYLKDSAAIIRGNAIDGENVSGNSPYGIYISGSTGTIMLYNNTVVNLKSAGSRTYGVYISAGTVDLFNNTIDGGSGGEARAVDFRNGANVDFVNNILSGSENGSAPAYCIYEYTDSNPRGVRNNDFINTPGGAYYHRYNGSTYTTIAALEDIFTGLSVDEGSITVSENMAVSPSFADSDYRLGSGTPTSVSQGGANLSGEGFSTDKDGNTRTNPWSMGAYEYD